MFTSQNVIWALKSTVVHVASMGEIRNVCKIFFFFTETWKGRGHLVT